MLEAVSLLKNKQNELEKLAPPLREAVQNAKEQLRAVVCSQEKLAELQAKDPAALSLQEFTILRVHQETANLRAELDVCRVERDSARETSGRFEADAARLTRELRQAASTWRAPTPTPTPSARRWTRGARAWRASWRTPWSRWRC